MKRFLLLVVVPNIVFFSLIFAFYIFTDIGSSDTINGISPMFAPLQLEVLVTTILAPILVCLFLKEKFFSDED